MPVVVGYCRCHQPTQKSALHVSSVAPTNESSLALPPWQKPWSCQPADACSSP